MMMDSPLSSDDIWALKDRWLNETDADCMRMTQVKVLNVLEANGRCNLDSYAEADASAEPLSGLIAAQVLRRIMGETGFNLSTIYWACRRWARGAGADPR